jgi:hypothetical protein
MTPDFGNRLLFINDTYERYYLAFSAKNAVQTTLDKPHNLTTTSPNLPATSDALTPRKQGASEA